MFSSKKIKRGYGGFQQFVTNGFKNVSSFWKLDLTSDLSVETVEKQTELFFEDHIFPERKDWYFANSSSYDYSV
jgi:hypothetical protein